MKKHKLATIRRQARALVKVCKGIRSIKRTRKTSEGWGYTYTRNERFQIQKDSGPCYRPTDAPLKIRGMSDYQKAAIFRALSEEFDRKQGYEFPEPFYWHTKNALCNLVFKKKMWYYTYIAHDVDGAYTIYMCYVPDTCGVPTWDDDKRSMVAAFAKYPIEFYNWIKIPQ